MKDARFHTMVRFQSGKALPHVAYITDHATGMKFSNSFETKELASEWIEQSKKVLTKGKAL